jgi:long-chain acyl-CoA synthetase
LATIDQDNNIVICGRQKDLIVNKGIKIYPQEVENVIMTHPEVTSVGVVGLPDNDTEVPVAFVAVRKIYDSLTNELMQLCTMKLAPYKVPRAFYLEKELPMTATGKIDKKVLRKKLHE